MNVISEDEMRIQCGFYGIDDYHFCRQMVGVYHLCGDDVACHEDGSEWSVEEFNQVWQEEVVGV